MYRSTYKISRPKSGNNNNELDVIWSCKSPKMTKCGEWACDWIALVLANKIKSLQSWDKFELTIWDWWETINESALIWRINLPEWVKVSISLPNEFNKSLFDAIDWIPNPACSIWSYKFDSISSMIYRISSALRAGTNSFLIDNYRKTDERSKFLHFSYTPNIDDFSSSNNVRVETEIEWFPVIFFINAKLENTLLQSIANGWREKA